MMKKLTRRTLLCGPLASSLAPLVTLAATDPEWTEAKIDAARGRGVAFDCWVNGIKRDRVLRACPERGFIEVAARHPVHGGYYVARGEVVRETIFGWVTVEPL